MNGPRIARGLALLALFLGVLGANYRMIDRYGSDLPYWDQWDAEGDMLIRPLAEGRLHFPDLFRPHAEHRIFFTRATALGLFLANHRQWDARLEMAVNAWLHAAFAVLLAALAFRLLPGAAAAAFAGVLAVFFAGDASWENVLGGFQSQFYFLLLFTAVHLAGSLASTRRRWLAVGSVAGACALVSMGSGVLSAVAVLAVLALKRLRDHRLSSRERGLAAFNAALCLAGALLRSRSGGNDFAHAGSLAGWLGAFWHEGEWPEGRFWMVPLNTLPALVLGAAWLRRRVASAAAPLLLAAWLWYALQSAALAYARGAIERHAYSYRYTDVREIGLLASLLMLALLAREAPSPRARKGWYAAAVGLAVAGTACMVGLAAMADRDNLPKLPPPNRARDESVRHYLKDGDSAFFDRKPWDQLPYPDAQRLSELLDLDSIRAALPATVRPPISWQMAPSRPGGASWKDYPPAGPAGTPPMELAGRWAEAGPGSSVPLETEPFASDRGMIGLFLAASPATRAQLVLVDEAGRRHRPLGGDPTSIPRWRRINFALPPGRYRLEAKAEGGWVAITQPFTDTRLSQLARKVTGLGPQLLQASAVAVLIAALAAAWPRRQEASAPAR